MNKAEFLASGKLDFTVSKRKMAYMNTLSTEPYKETPFYCTVNDKTGNGLGPVRSKYTIIQNRTLLDKILDNVTSYNLEKSKCGMFDGGKRIFFFIYLENQDNEFGDDKIDYYLYALSSHDGSQRVVLGITTRMHSCSNMFATLMSNKDNNFILKHTAGLNNIDNKSISFLVFKNIQGIKSMYIKMEQTILPVDEQERKNVVEEFVDLFYSIKNRERVKKVIYDNRKRLEHSITLECDSKGANYYGLFNGLTHYTTHFLEKKDTVKSKRYDNFEHQKLDSLVSLTASNFNKKGLEYIYNKISNN